MYLPMGNHGIVSVTDTDVDAFDQSDVELASMLAASAETALDRLATERELERRNARLDEFASVVAHDLRNPLGISIGWLEIARRDHDSESLVRVQEGLDRMATMIEDLLAIARNGDEEAAPEPVNLATIVDACWRTVDTGEARLINETDRVVRADERRLKQLLENLFRNAVEHGGNDVTVMVGDAIEGFYVADNGPGIPTEFRAQVFEPGYSTNETGTGYGLSIVKRVADAHGWDVSVGSSASGGARFDVTDVDVVR